jgi:hypothetical protein
MKKNEILSKLYLFHHDPDRTDNELYAILDDARQIFPQSELATEFNDFNSLYEGAQGVENEKFRQQFKLS